MPEKSDADRLAIRFQPAEYKRGVPAILYGRCSSQSEIQAFSSMGIYFTKRLVKRWRCFAGRCFNTSGKHSWAIHHMPWLPPHQCIYDPGLSLASRTSASWKVQPLQRVLWTPLVWKGEPSLLPPSQPILPIIQSNQVLLRKMCRWNTGTSPHVLNETKIPLKEEDLLRAEMHLFRCNPAHRCFFSELIPDSGLPSMPPPCLPESSGCFADLLHRPRHSHHQPVQHGMEQLERRILCGGEERHSWPVSRWQALHHPGLQGRRGSVPP